jgi:Tfp pilus assembly protein FimT
MMPRQTSKTNSSQRRLGGFSAVELLIMATIISIITAFGLIGITRARASVRLSGAAREYASYVEKARIFSIRNHADDAAERATVAISAARSSYDVTMDLDGDGGMDTRTINLPSGISFETVETIAFDWRGRTWSTVAGVTSPNAQVSIRLLSSDDSVSVDVTGSGDITIDSHVFDDSVPNVTLKVGDLAAGATPVPTPDDTTPVGGDPLPSPTPLIELPDVLPSPPPIFTDGLPVATPTPNGNGNGNGNPNATPTPTPSPTPTPTPVVPCRITTDKALIVMGKDVTTTIKVSHDSTTSVSITGTTSKPSDLQVSPGGAQTIGANSATTFTIKSKKTGVYSVTFSSNCGSKTISVTVLL